MTLDHQVAGIKSWALPDGGDVCDQSLCAPVLAKASLGASGASVPELPLIISSASEISR